MEPRACLQCKGTGVLFSKGFTSLEGKVYPDTERQCYACQGSKTFAPPNAQVILPLIVSKRGKLRLLTAFPAKLDRFKDLNAGRAYYVWRLARFHGGKDTTLPMTAGMVTRGDPFKDELDKMADQVAKEFFGTDLAGAVRWGQAFGMLP